MLYLRFSLLPDVERRLATLRVARDFLDGGLSEPSPVLPELRRHAVATSAHYSTRIEGNVLELGQVESLLRGEQVAAEAAQLREAVNYAEAIRYVQNVAAQPFQTLTEETIKSIHFMVTKSLPGWYEPGRYRKEQNYIVDRGSRSVVFRPPSPEDVAGLMREFVEWLNVSSREPEPVFTAALAHLNFVAIHPFADGNGRTARIIEALVLYRAGYRSHELVSLEEFFGSDTESYYAAIRNSVGPIYQPERRDVAMWMDYYLQAHVTQAAKAVDRQTTAISQHLTLMEAFDLDEVDALALYVACQDGKLSNSIYRTLADVTNQTAAIHLRRLTEKGLLAPIGRGRASRYEPTVRALDVFNSVVPESIQGSPSEEDPPAADTTQPQLL